ncbi:tetratricopeptide repeat protein [Mucilaginibacter agri]|uniref:Tetratricopeptide repeat protein n=1 Tax=Mucilaginibacter agri TaxID=2695265 RepID=A0A965ZIQ4_9SPHI|nr:tetratricopeptide repeat protein [Mucilaginibacter agri]NCD71854.1 tetratricopeptide repeat protein [Mucilaginibacter agri]
MLRLLMSLLLCCGYFSARAQTSAGDLIKQGIELHNQGNYTEAINKFNEALKIEPENGYANYEMAFSYYALKKPDDAIGYLNKAIKTDNAKLKVAAYSLLASIYDDNKQPQKAIDTYNEAIKINPDYPQIYYNLGIAYSRAGKYPEAEQAAIDAIKHNPKDPSSQRLYGLVTFHQNKRVNALMGLCSFILLEPTGTRAAEAYGNIQHILQGGILKDANGNTSISLSPKDDQQTSTLNLSLSLIAQSASSKKLSSMDLLEYQLKNIFTMAGELAAKKTDKTFFDKFYVDYFYKLAQTNYMPAFAHTIALTDTKANNATWGKQNTQQINDLGQWLQTTQRDF